MYCKSGDHLSLNNLEINIGKTVQMTFKKGGKQAQGDTLKVVKKFRYLGVTVQKTMNSFTYHIQEGTEVVKAIYGMKNLRRLSNTTVIALFKNVIKQKVTY